MGPFDQFLDDVLGLPWISQPTVSLVSCPMNTATKVVSADATRKLLILSGDTLGPYFLRNGSTFTSPPSGLCLTATNPMLIMTTATFGLLPTLEWWAIQANAVTGNLAVVQGRLSDRASMSQNMIQKVDNGTFKYPFTGRANGARGTKLDTNRWAKQQAPSRYDLPDCWDTLLGDCNRPGGG